MKIRSPLAIRGTALVAAYAIRNWMGSLGYRYHHLGPQVDPTRPDFVGGRYIYAFWHEGLLLPAYVYARSPIHILISQHADGEMMALACRQMGIKVLRGSTTRGAAKALREMMKVAEYSNIAIAPDGPRGPRRQAQPGMVYLAARTGLPVVPVGMGFDRPWRVNSWDRMALPRPFSQAAVVLGRPIAVPADLPREEIATTCRRIETELNTVTAMAQQLAERGTVAREVGNAVAAPDRAAA